MQLDWKQDVWFAEHHAIHVTTEFEAWWIDHYGCPDDYTEDPEEQHEYFVRAAFALMGWRAALAKAKP